MLVICRTIGKIILLLGLIMMAVYVLSENLFRPSCDTIDAYAPPPYRERDGILELTWVCDGRSVFSLKLLILDYYANSHRINPQSRCARAQQTMRHLQCFYAGASSLQRSTSRHHAALNILVSFHLHLHADHNPHYDPCSYFSTLFCASLDRQSSRRLLWVRSKI